MGMASGNPVQKCDFRQNFVGFRVLSWEVVGISRFFLANAAMIVTIGSPALDPPWLEILSFLE